MPKSSIASRTPSALSSWSRSSTASVCCISTLSVISRITADGSTPELRQRVAQRVGEPGALELAAGDVDRHRERRLRIRLPPRLHLAAGLVQHPPAQPHDEPGLLRQRDEVLRQQVAVGRVLPADQRLDPVDRAGAELDDRLVVQGQLALASIAARSAASISSRCAHVGVHPRLVGLRASLAPALGGVHRDVGVAQQVVGGLARGRRWRRRCWRSPAPGCRSG